MKFITIEHENGEITIPLEKLTFVSKNISKAESYFSVCYIEGSGLNCDILTEDQYNKLLKQLHNIDNPFISEKENGKQFLDKLTPEQLQKFKDSFERMVKL